MIEAPSVVIPTLNEEEYLLRLLDALHRQTLPPREIIVADAGSTDRTAESARESGCIVVQGGMPAVGRNAGASVAKADIIVFLDADVAPRPNFLADAIAEFEAGGYSVATTLIESLEPGATNEFMADAVGLYLQMTKPISPHAPGSCIFVRREAHFAVGGFNEQVVLAEDHDYVQRVAKVGEFGILTSVRIPVSMRRMDEESLLPLALNYVWSEMHALAGKPVYSSPFEYTFGEHGEARSDEEKPVIDLAFLRDYAEEVRESFEQVSASGKEKMDEFGEMASPESLKERALALLDAGDLAVMQQYLHWRVSAAGEPGASTLSKGAATVHKGLSAMRRGIAAASGEKDT